MIPAVVPAFETLGAYRAAFLAPRQPTSDVQTDDEPIGSRLIIEAELLDPSQSPSMRNCGSQTVHVPFTLLCYLHDNSCTAKPKEGS